jgi:general secretion pathway protein E
MRNNLKVGPGVTALRMEAQPLDIAQSQSSAAPGTDALSLAALRDAMRLAASTGRPLLEVAEEQSALTADTFVAALATTFHYGALTMQDLRQAPPRFDLLPFADCMQRCCYAFGAATEITCAISDPFDVTLIDWLTRRLPAGFRIALAHRNDVAAILSHHEESMRAMQDIVGGHDDAEGESAIALDLSIVSITEDASPIVRLVNSTIYDALKVAASDIHIETDSAGLHVKYRIDGVLVEVAHVPGIETAEQVVSRIKVLADLDIAERRVPQDGRFKVRIKGADIDFRVSVIPSIYGEDAVLRLLDRRSVTGADELRLESLGLDPSAATSIRQLAVRPHGMLLVTGPTGSGKTTTLYAAISEINNGRDKIVTIEDPVEYRLPRVLQIPVNEKKGLTFARGLRSILRHDPDKIMVGEIRDPETAQIAVQAALTGHLVFTTVHANSVFDVLSRFLHMDVDPYGLASALNGIVAQRLLRRNCPHCTLPRQPKAGELETCGLDLSTTESWSFRAGHGCGHCRGTGYKGRRAAAEVLLVDDALRNLIATKAPVLQLKEEARRRGMVTVRERALQLVATGETTLEEVNRVAA